MQSKITNIVEECFPLKQSSKHYVFKMSAGLMKSRDKKNRLLRQYKQGRIPKERYTQYNKIYRKLIQIEQTKVFENDMREAGLNGKKMEGNQITLSP